MFIQVAARGHDKMCIVLTPRSNFCEFLAFSLEQKAEPACSHSKRREIREVRCQIVTNHDAPSNQSKQLNEAEPANDNITKSPSHLVIAAL